MRANEWRARLAVATAGLLLFLILSGLSIWLLPFGIANQVMVLAHTVLGLLFLVPCAWYLARHFTRYGRNPLSHLQVLGYGGGVALVVCVVSGAVVTWESAFVIAANQMIPPILKLKGWEKQVELTEQWLRGAYEIPEIAHKWVKGPAVAIELDAPEKIRPGDKVPIKVVVT